MNALASVPSDERVSAGRYNFFVRVAVTAHRLPPLRSVCARRRRAAERPRCKRDAAEKSCATPARAGIFRRDTATPAVSPPRSFHPLRRRYDLPPDPFRDLRHDCVAEAFKSVHPSGYPMSHSTHIGFNCPPIWSGSVGVESPWVRSRQLFAHVPFQSREVGLRNSTSVTSSRPPPMRFGRFQSGTRFPSLAVGVAHPLRPEESRRLGESFVPSELSGVGNNPDAFADVRRANVRSSNACPLRVIPDLGQVSENSAHSPVKQSCDVFQDREARS